MAIENKRRRWAIRLAVVVPLATVAVLAYAALELRGTIAHVGAVGAALERIRPDPARPPPARVEPAGVFRRSDGGSGAAPARNDAAGDSVDGDATGVGTFDDAQERPEAQTVASPGQASDAVTQTLRESDPELAELLDDPDPEVRKAILAFFDDEPE